MPTTGPVPHTEARRTTYVAATAFKCGKWIVYNSISNRNVASGLTRHQAMTLAHVLNLACSRNATAFRRTMIALRDRLYNPDDEQTHARERAKRHHQ